jgi:hypothetical protein
VSSTVPGSASPRVSATSLPGGRRRGSGPTSSAWRTAGFPTSSGRTSPRYSRRAPSASNGDHEELARVGERWMQPQPQVVPDRLQVEDRLVDGWKLGAAVATRRLERDALQVVADRAKAHFQRLERPEWWAWRSRYESRRSGMQRPGGSGRNNTR